MKDALKNALLIVAGLVIVTLGLFIAYKQIENNKRMEDIQQSIIEQKQLIDNITRSSSTWASKDDFEKILKAQDLNLKAIQKDIDALNGAITGIQNIAVVSNGQTTTNVPSTTTTPNGDATDPNAPDPFGYLKNTQNLQLSEQFSNVAVPIGSVSFSASQEKPWSLSIPERKYNVTSVLAHDKEGKSLAYSKFSIDTEGKRYDVQIAENKMVEQYPSNSFSFNPRILGSIGIGASIPTKTGSTLDYAAPVGLGISLFSYGRTKSEPSILLVNPNVFYDLKSKKAGASISPVLFSIGKITGLPLHNSYIGPSIGYQSNGVFLGTTLSVSF